MALEEEQEREQERASKPKAGGLEPATGGWLEGEDGVGAPCGGALEPACAGELGDGPGAAASMEEGGEGLQRHDRDEGEDGKGLRQHGVEEGGGLQQHGVKDEEEDEGGLQKHGAELGDGQLRGVGVEEVDGVVKEEGQRVAGMLEEPLEKQPQEQMKVLDTKVSVFACEMVPP